MHPEDLTWFSEMREVLRDAGYDPDEIQVDDLFVDGELRLWEDDAGWSGYVREEIGDAVVYHRVNTRFDEDRWIDRVVVGEQAVREAVRQHIRDPLAGGAGTFRRGCSPP